MMHPEVLIVLNEREPEKLRAAETLFNKLKERDITPSRISASQKLFETIKEASPQILVLDYLLGDVTTGVDLLERLNSELKVSPQVIFLTDELSVPVAVQAMKAGAINYYQLENPASVSQLVEEICEVLRTQKVRRKSLAKALPRLDSLVAQSQASLELMRRAKARALDPSPITIIQGRPGSGRSTLAESIFRARQSPSYYRAVDYDLYEDSLEELLNFSSERQLTLSLGTDISLTLDHVEFDNGLLLDFVTKRLKQIWPGFGTAGIAGNKSFLTICTSCVETMKSWARLSGAEPLVIKPLSERREDIAPLIQRFINEVQELSGAKIPSLSAETLLWLTNQDWIGETKQLRAVVFESALIGLNAKDDIRSIFESNIERWNEDHTNWEKDVDPLLAARALELCDYNYRVTAARLGTTVSHLRSLLDNGGPT